MGVARPPRAAAAGLPAAGAGRAGPAALLRWPRPRGLNTAAQLGTALGVAGLLLIAATTRGSGLPLAGTPLAWAFAAAIAAVGALLIRPRPSAQPNPGPTLA